MSTIYGHKRVQVIKDPVEAKWKIQDMDGNEICNVSFSFAFGLNWLDAPTDDYYAAIYTCCVYEPLTDKERKDVYRRWPDLRNTEELEVEPADKPAVTSEKKAEKPKTVSTRRKVQT